MAMTRFYRNAAFEAVQEGEAYYIRHRQSGDCVRVDEVLFDLWNAADEQAIEQVGARHRLDPVFLKQVTRLMARADLLTHDELCPPVQPLSPVTDGPLVSIVVLNMDGRQHLETCLSSLFSQTYRNIEIILVDNGSRDDSVAFVRERFPTVRVLELGENRGFSGGNNAGFDAASGEYVFVLNNDTEVAPGCIAEMMHVIERDAQIAAVAPMIKLFYLRSFLNGIGNTLGPIGWGSDSYIGHLDLGQFGEAREIFSACFGAALLHKSVLDRIGQLDPGFHIIYYEDADWCYRARMAGYKVFAAPRAVVYHKFNATMKTAPSAFKLMLVVRNRLRYVVKNLQFGTALRFGACYLAEDIYHVLEAVLGGDWPVVGAYFKGWRGFMGSLPEALQQRERVQRLRVQGLTDRQLFAPTRQVPPPQLDNNVPLLTMQNIREYYMQVEGNSHSRRVLVVSPDVVDTCMAGPGIRCWELARTLGGEFDVTLAVPGQCDMAADGFRIVSYHTGRGEKLKGWAHEADVVIVSGYLVSKFPFLRHVGRPLVVDVYDPFIIENLHFNARGLLDDRMAIHRNDLAVLNEQLQCGDWFICASEKQRDYYLGLLMANNRINPRTWEDDPSLRRLIDVVPFGLPAHSPQPRETALKGIVPGIGAGDQVILWGGGVWEWLDPLTAIRAMPRVIQACPRAKLFFIGIRHPNAEVPVSRMSQSAIELSRELGLLDKCVFFRDWTPYAERESYLLEADVGISLHSDHLETRLSSRTRVLDYIWAGLPIVTSGGDAMSELVAREGLGRVVECQDVTAVAEAIVDLLSRPDYRSELASSFARVAEQLRWERTAKPLAAYCRAPWFAADKVNGEVKGEGGVVTPDPTPVYKLPGKAWRLVRQRGIRALWREILSYTRWALTRFV
jgi:GT2 family glycosyltransferase/glycosyltransferase involved in cell wall biosynthesis